MRRLPMLADPFGSLELISDDLKDTSRARPTFKRRLKTLIGRPFVGQLSVLSGCLSCLSHACTVAKRLDGSR